MASSSSAAAADINNDDKNDKVRSIVGAVMEYSRRSRPRAKSVDSHKFSALPNKRWSLSTARWPKLAADSARSKETEYDAGTGPAAGVDELAPLLHQTKSEVLSSSFNRSYSLDSSPYYHSLISSAACSILASGFSVTLKSHKQNSIITIFSIWNTIIGSSLLAMPWSIEKAGLAVAFVLMMGISTLAVYTAYRLLNVQLIYGNNETGGDVPYLCKKLLGNWAEFTARIFSFIIIFGANIVYWILMSNCLYHLVNYFASVFFTINNASIIVTAADINEGAAVLCPAKFSANVTSSSNTTDVEIGAGEKPTLFQKIWNLDTTVPIILAVIVAPLLNFKSATFFTKFNSIGTLSVIYLLIFVIMKSVSWGINVNFIDETEEDYVSLYEKTFFATSGMLPLSLFIHNIVITLMKSNRNQQHNSRDLSIAYILVVLTYVLIGFTFYICFPLQKSCIEDNMLNNFPESDILTVGARIFLFFQLLTVFPLLSYMLRVQIFSAFSSSSFYPNTSYIIFLNFINMLGCILFAVFLPQIGTIIRFTGAMCGFVYIFTLPSMLHLASQKEKHSAIKLSSSLVIHIFIPVIGLINLIGQFYV